MDIREWLTVRKNAHLVNSHLDGSVQNEVGASNNSSIDLAARQRAAGHVGSVHGRRTSRVDCETVNMSVFLAKNLELDCNKPGSTKVEHVTDSVTQDGVAVSSHAVCLGVFHIPQGHHAVVNGKVTNVGTDVLSRYTVQ